MEKNINKLIALADDLDPKYQDQMLEEESEGEEAEAINNLKHSLIEITPILQKITLNQLGRIRRTNEELYQSAVDFIQKYIELKNQIK